MGIAFLLLAMGGALLYFGGEALVKGAASFASRRGVSRLVVGLTVVAFGTSAPEFFVSLLAALHGNADIALGNIVGSNIFNIAFILGIAALIFPLIVQTSTVKYEIPLAALAAAALWGVGTDGEIGRAEGMALLAFFGLFLGYCLRGTQNTAEGAPGVTLPAAWQDALYVVLGLGALVGGANLFVRGASDIARASGVSEWFIGLSVVAAGTSLPELATSLVAAMRKESDIAVGNVVGSNIFNILFILGFTSLVHPVACRFESLCFDIPVMLGVSLLLLLFCWNRRLGRVEGALFLIIYAGYVAYIAIRE